MADADCLMITSKVETFCLVAAEALCSGTPVLSTRCGGPEEIVIDQELGYLVSENNSLSLAQGIANMISNLSSFDRDRIASRTCERYDMNKIAEKLESVYKSCVA
jgi:glycosyltransferase involved in cell wall biosynthesis